VFVIESTPSKIVDGVVMKVVFSTTSKSSLDGIGYRLRRANKAKATLDEIRMTPGSQTGQASSDAYLMRAASGISNLEYLAGSRNTLESFEEMIHLLDKEILSGARQEVEELFNSLKQVSHVDEERLLIDTTIKNDIVEPFSTLPQSNPTKVTNRVARAIALLDDVL